MESVFPSLQACRQVSKGKFTSGHVFLFKSHSVEMCVDDQPVWMI